jgi:hypothetical protein
MLRVVSICLRSSQPRSGEILNCRADDIDPRERNFP